MKGVLFTRNMAPFGRGQPALLPDDVADRMIGQGAAKPHDFPAQPHAHDAPAAQPYPTKDGASDRGGKKRG